MDHSQSFWNTTRPLIAINRVGNNPISLHFGDEARVIYKHNGRYFLAAARCHHRGMRLDTATVTDDGKLKCQYHGKCTLASEELTEYYGVLWHVKTTPARLLNDQDTKDGYVFCGYKEYDLSAPFHVVLDNFNEGSHTPHIHTSFGPSASEFKDSEFSWRSEKDFVEIQYSGPQRKNFSFYGFNWFRKLRLHIRWETYSDPTYMKYHSSWTQEPGHYKVLADNLNYYFISPISDTRTRLQAFVFIQPKPWMKFIMPIVKFISLLMTNRQIMEDESLYSNIRDIPKDIEEYTLDSFDQPLLEIRRRCLEKIPKKYLTSK